MKTKIILSFFIICVSYILNAQNYKFTYDVKYHMDIDTIKHAGKKLHAKYVLDGISNIKGILTTNGVESSFIQEGDLRSNAKSKNNFISNYYTDLKSKKNYKLNAYESVFDNTYFNFSDFEWKITKEKRIIGKYTCYKAVGVFKSVKVENFNFNKDLVVWYCPDFPFPFGPEYFVGLPGLVFEAYSADGSGVHWKLAKIEKTKNTQITKPQGKSLHNQEADKLLMKEYLKFTNSVKR